MTRREARELAFMLVFEWEFNRLTIDELIENAIIGRQIEINDFAKKLAQGAVDQMSQIDLIVEACSTKWKKSRITKVSLAALRVAIFELVIDKKVPVKVVINEAIELTKKYAGEGDASFVNGVLGAVVKQYREKKPENAAPESPEESVDGGESEAKSEEKQ